MGGDFPIGVTLARGARAQVFQPGTHGATFGGNSLAVTVANTVLIRPDAPLLAGIGERHMLIVDQLNAVSARHGVFSAMRGAGLLIGIELAGSLCGKAKTLTNLVAEGGLIALTAGPDVLRFTSALNIPLANIAEAFVYLDHTVVRLTRQPGGRPVMLPHPVRENDLDDIVCLAVRVRVDMTSLPHDVECLMVRIRRSIRTFVSELPYGQ